MFNGASVTQSEIQKHLGTLPDLKLDFKENMQNVRRYIYKYTVTWGFFSTLFLQSKEPKSENLESKSFQSRT